MNEEHSVDSNPVKASPASTGNQPLPVRRPIWKPILLSLVIFLSGVIAGTCPTLIMIRQQIHHRIHHPEEIPGKVASRIQWKFGLSDEQTKQVEVVLSERQQAIQRIRRDFQPRLELELDQLQKQVANLLNDSQRATWQKWFQEMRAEWLPAMP